MRGRLHCRTCIVGSRSDLRRPLFALAFPLRFSHQVLRSRLVPPRLRRDRPLPQRLLFVMGLGLRSQGQSRCRKLLPRCRRRGQRPQSRRSDRSHRCFMENPLACSHRRRRRSARGPSGASPIRHGGAQLWQQKRGVKRLHRRRRIRILAKMIRKLPWTWTCRPRKPRKRAVLV